MRRGSNTRGWTWAPLLCLLLLTASAQDRDRVRVVVEKAGDSPWPAAVGMVEICPVPALAGGKYSVTTSDGKLVQAQTLWSAVGEPMRVRFNTSSGATKYFVDYSTNAPSAPGGWNPEAGVVVETLTCKEGPINTREQVNRLVNSASPILGRGLAPQIFMGINPYGPSVFYVALFSGWFTAPQGGEYGFATVSTDASYLEIDGHLIAEWLGRHDPHGGRRGEHSGHVALRPGVHHLEYVQVQFNGEPAAEAAWKPPGQDHFELMPASAFPPVARFTVSQFESPPAAPGTLYFHWHNQDHARLGDSFLIKTRLRAIDAGQRREYRWLFDDGAEAAGAAVQHFFLEPGLRKVTLSAWQNGACIASNTALVRVSPNWLQRDDWRQDVFDEASNDFRRRDLSRMPGRDLGNVLEWAIRLEDQPLLVPVAEAILKRSDEFDSAGSGPVFYQLGLNLQHGGERGDQLAEQALRVAASSQRVTPTTQEKARLRLVDMLLHYAGQPEAAAKLLAGLSGNGLSVDERRLRKLFDGDLLLARGKVDLARNQYAAIADLPAKPGPRATFEHHARLESASILLQCAQFDDAQRALDLLTFERPLERLALDTGWLRVQVSLKRKEYQRAFTAARTLLAVAENDPRKSNLLYALVEAGLALGKTAEAQQALSQLIKEFPYSEAAARAKDQWGSRVPPRDHP